MQVAIEERDVGDDHDERRLDLVFLGSQTL